jgi:hypothetical protein
MPLTCNAPTLESHVFPGQGEQWPISDALNGVESDQQESSESEEFEGLPLQT